MKRLFELVSGLSEAEKAAFRASFSRHDAAQKIMFNSIAKTPYPSDEYLAKALHPYNIKKSSVGPIKTRLYKALLRFATQGNEEQRIDIEMNMILGEIEYLYSKAMMSAAENRMKYALQKSQNIESLEYQLLIKNKQRRIFGAQLKPTQLQLLIEELAHLSNAQREESDYHVLYSQMKDIRQKSIRSRSGVDLEYNQLLTHDLLLQNHQAKSWIGKIRKIQIQALVAYCRHDTHQEWLLMEEAVLLFDNRIELQKYYLLDYIAIFHRLLVLSKTERPDQYQYLLDQFIEIPQLFSKRKSKPIQHYVDSLAQSTEMVRLIDTQQTTLAFSLHVQQDKSLQPPPNVKPEMHINYWYKCAYICLLENKLGRAHQFCNAILKYYDGNIRSDIYGYTLLLQIILHSEAETNSIIGHLSQAARRFLVKHKLLFEAEKWILKILKNAHKISSPQHKKEYYEQQRHVLNEIMNDPLQKLSLAYFNSQKWIDKKIHQLQDNKELPTR